MKILTDDGDDDIWVLAGDVGEERKDIVQDKHLVKALQEVVHARQRVDPHLTHNHTRCTALRDTALCDGTHTQPHCVAQRCETQHCVTARTLTTILRCTALRDTALCDGTHTQSHALYSAARRSIV